MDVVVRHSAAGQHRVDLVVPQYRGGEVINLGHVLKDTSGVTPNWWAYGYHPNQAILGKSKYPIPGHPDVLMPKMEKTQGFATRRMAIEHMLRRCGYWED